MMRPLYVEVGGESVLCFLHEADGTDGPAVLMCPPFGREDAASYRSRREWADSLARAGMPVLRFDLQGTGDSGGAVDEPGRFDSWVDTVGALAAFLQQETRGRMAAIGIGLGGVLAVAAAAEGAPLDELVLWGVPGHGRALARELTTFARIEAESIVAAGAPEPPPGAPQEIAPGGFVLPADLLTALQQLDLTALRLPAVGRALVLGRDGIAPDLRLRMMLEASGARVDVADGDGYGDMLTVLPEAARLPDGVRERVETWLSASPPDLGARAKEPSSARSSRTADLAVGGAAVVETPFEVDHRGHRLVGVLGQPVGAPTADLALVLLNAGAIRRSGPGRLWVDLARRRASQGIPTLRVDLGGIGDASGGTRLSTVADLYSPVYVDQVRAALDALSDRAGVHRFALLGLCSGAYWGFHTALVDDRVRLALMLNPRLLFWDPEIVASYDARNRRSRLVQGNAWREFRSMPLGSLPRRAVTVTARLAAEPLKAGARRRARRDATAATEAAFDRLEAGGVSTVFAFCDGEPLRETVAATGVGRGSDQWPSIELIDLPGRDHVLRPLWMHEHVHRVVDSALAAELARAQ